MSTRRIEVLAESHRRAVARLAEARDEADRLRRGAESEALELLRAQQDEASRLLGRQQQKIADSQLTPEDEEALVEGHRKAAELLRDAEGRVAIHVGDVAEAEIALVLMRGSRDAAAILMDAWNRADDVAGEE